VKSELESEGIPTIAEMAYGEPAKEIIKWVEEKEVDLVAMRHMDTSFSPTLFLGTTADRVPTQKRRMCRCFFFERSDAPAEDAFLAAPVNQRTAGVTSLQEPNSDKAG